MKHLDTAERLQFFLAQQKLSRERFLQEIQNAITRSSLMSLLNGHRRPARTFALLLEWKWGFRADFLLHGKGEPWKSAGTGKAGLSPLEQDVVSFMRDSPAKAQDMQGALESATLWNRLYARMEFALERLGTLDTTDPHYPALVSLTLEDCWRLAGIHQHYGDLTQTRRVLRLTQRFMKRFVLPASAGNAEMAELMSSLESRCRSVELALRNIHDMLQQQEGATLSLDILLDMLSHESADLVREIVGHLEGRRALLEASGVPVGPLVDRWGAHRAQVDVGAWSAWLRSRLGQLDRPLPEQNRVPGPADYRLEFRRLLTLIRG